MISLKQNFSRFAYGMLCCVYLLFLLGLNFITPLPASALTASNFALFPGSDVNAVNRDYPPGVNTDGYFERAGLKNISILVKDFPGLGDIGIPYNQQMSHSFGVDEVIGEDREEGAGELFFSTQYFCSDSNGAISKQPPANAEYYVVEYAVGLYKSFSGEFASLDSYTVAGGPTKITRKYPPSVGKSDEIVFEIGANREEQEVGPDQLDNFTGQITSRSVPAGCMPASIVGQNTSIRNYNKLPEAQKQAFATSLASVPAGGTGGSADDDKSCDTRLNSPLSWILCPTIELMSNFTEFAFNDVIKPLLSDVPVSTNPDDGSYKAWQQFRLIGNIVLVGAMIAVVYAQVKGG